MRSETCDIFCKVVDNFGDIGVCWRLARLMANEHGITVRLWVDDLSSFGKLYPRLNVDLDVQSCRGVEVRRWIEKDNPLDLRDRRVIVVGDEGHRYRSQNGDENRIQPADLLIEAFACQIPQSYVEAMASRVPKSVWINLEYLSAEDWVDGCHKLPSPHSLLPLTKYYFFPGFSGKTGGLLLERNLLARRDTFQSDVVLQNRFWLSLDIPPRVSGELRVSLFGYENEAIESLLNTWEKGTQPVTCLVPEGRSLPQVASFFGQSIDHLRTNGSPVGGVLQRGRLRVHILPFIDQEHYDELLWGCDMNFVRGEDSCVRAQWAARPFIWQIYPQHDGVHLDKLEALWVRYTAGLTTESAQAVRDMWRAWNGGKDIAEAWSRFVAQQVVLTRHGGEWARRLAPNNLTLNLLDFYRQVA